LCAYYLQESRKNDRRRSSMSPRWYTSAITGLPIAITAPGPPAVVPQGVADGASVLLVIACPQRNQRHFVTSAISKSDSNIDVPLAWQVRAASITSAR
jgi:hypothetical protein